MQKIKTPWGQIFLLIMGGFVFAVLSGELFVRAFNTDFLLIKKILYIQLHRPTIHKVSADARRLYELGPDTVLVNDGCIHPKETKYKTHDVTVNKLGFRGREYPRFKKKGICRIIVFGGSNTFGPAVSDEDTYPAQMQKIFDEKYPGKVEVWNAGISGYVMSQDAAYAESAVKEFDPDLLIFQDTNLGRRAFLAKTTSVELKGLFGKNSELFVENIPFFGTGNGSLRYRINDLLILKSAFYRAFYVTLFACRWNIQNQMRPTRESFEDRWEAYANEVSERDLDSFTGRHKDKKIVLFYLSDGEYHRHLAAIKMRENMSAFVLNVLNNRNAPTEQQDAHPPSHVYAWYARELCGFLVRNGYVPVNNGVPKGAASL